MVLVQQMIVLFVMIGIGFVCGKKKFITNEFARNLSWLVVNVATPAMILAAGMNEESAIRGSDLAFAFLLTGFVYAFLIAVSFVLLPLVRVPSEDKSVYRVMTIFTNIGFMGLPILQAAYGDEAVLYGSLFQFPFNFLIYTYGIAALRGESAFKGGLKFSKFLNAGIISCLISLTIYIAHIPMPSFIVSSARSLGSVAAPLSMMVIGQSLTQIDLKEMLSDVRLWLFSLIKLTIVPAIGIFLLGLFVRDKMLLQVCFIMLATPIASMCAMLPQQYGGNYKLAAKGVALSTLLSVVTIPLVSFFFFSC
ncbi:AEC family transporter [Butyrivibrio sp. CB08]|uniref:AEC family transporter n=1 Tax=Butyrivibrio sp. CB08 TaxID=2364879 RepID=UPI000EA89B16|nr:AEC family transporter [Butyrivibrio sp. CB08]RKM61411.1 AEC family transporter [Butyrivibrio sp. CB08]